MCFSLLKHFRFKYHGSFHDVTLRFVSQDNFVTKHHDLFCFVWGYIRQKSKGLGRSFTSLMISRFISRSLHNIATTSFYGLERLVLLVYQTRLFKFHWCPVLKSFAFIASNSDPNLLFNLMWCFIFQIFWLSHVRLYSNWYDLCIWFVFHPQSLRIRPVIALVFWG